MRLVIDGFTKGLYDERVMSKANLARPEENGDSLIIKGMPCVDDMDVDFYPLGTLSKRRGNENLTASPWKSAAITKIYQYTSSAMLDYTMAFSCSAAGATAGIGTVAMTNGAAVVTSKPISAGGWRPLISNPIETITFAGSALMSYQGDQKIYVYAGGDNCYPLTAAPSGAAAMASWGNYMFVANMVDIGGTYERRRSRIRWCFPYNVENWPDGYYIDLDPDDGDEITALWNFKDFIIVFKRYKTYVVKWVGGTLLFDFERKDVSVGCMNCNSLIDIDDSIYFISTGGIMSFDGYNPPVSLVESIEKLYGGVNVGTGVAPFVDYYEDKDQVLFVIPYDDSTTNNMAFVLNRVDNSWTKFTTPWASSSNILYNSVLTYADLPNSYDSYDFYVSESALGGDYFLGVGKYDGNIGRFGYTNDDLGVAINSYWMSPWIDFGQPDFNKKITRMHFLLDKVDGKSITLEIYKDWNDTDVYKTETISMDGSAATIEKRVDFVMPCRAFRFRISANSIGATFSIHRIIVDFQMKGRTLVI